MPKRTDLETILLIGSGPDRDRAGSRVRLLRHPGGARAQGGGLPGRPGQLESRDDHDRPGAGRPDLHRAGHAGVGRQGDRAGAARRAAAHDGRPDRAQRGDGAAAGRHAGPLRRGADRRQRARHPDRRGPRGVRRRRCGGSASPRRQGGRCGAWRRGSPRSRRPAIPAILRPSFTLGGTGGGIAYNLRRVRDDAAAGAGAVSGALGAGGAERHRLEGVRARGDARRRRQRRDRLLHREPRPDGRAHRRLDHRGARDDAHRSRVPGDARRRDPDHPRDRRGGRRLQHPVRGEPGHRRAAGDRDEPAGLALLGARLQGDRASRSRGSAPRWRSATGWTSCPTTSPAPRRPRSSRCSTTWW